MSILSPLAKLSLKINVASYGELYIISGTDLGIPNPTCLVLSVTGTDIPSGYDAECVINAFKKVAGQILRLTLVVFLPLML